MKGFAQRGFTLWELMITLAVAGVVLGIGVPGFKEFLRNSTMTAEANDLVTGLLLARSEALKRQAPVTLCATAAANAATPTCGTSWKGFVVFADANGNAAVDAGEKVLLRREAAGGALGVWIDGGGYVLYGANGFKRKADGKTEDSASNVLLCDDRGNRNRGGVSTARLVTIDPIGRPLVETSPTEISDQAGKIPDASCP